MKTTFTVMAMTKFGVWEARHTFNNRDDAERYSNHYSGFYGERTKILEF